MDVVELVCRTEKNFRSFVASCAVGDSIDWCETLPACCRWKTIWLHGWSGSMSWVGTWKNQYGSTLEITNDADGRIFGEFRTALEDSGFYGQTVAVVGVHRGNCISFGSAGTSATGDRVVSYA